MKTVLVLAVLCAVLGGGVARADEPAGDAERPWAAGVSAEDQEAALALFRDGNDAFAHTDYVEAARRYRAALDRWGHPAIHGNLAVTLIQLDDPVGAYDHLEQALAFGDAPFDATQYERLATDRKLVLGQLGRLEVTCDVDGAEVSVDGETVITGIGTISRVVRAGSYQVVARKANYLTFARQVVALPEQPVVIRVDLVPLDQAGGLERRWASWKPWAVIGAGAAVLALGVGYQLAAQRTADDFEAEIARSCPSGCPIDQLPPPVLDLEDRATRQNRIGVSAMITGAAALIAGGVMVYANQPHRVRLEESGRRVGAAPLLRPGAIGLVLAGRF